jgi:uncharacterized protein
MQDIMPQLGAGAQLVRSYGPQGFRIGQDAHESHVLVLPTQTVAWSGELTVEALAPLLAAEPVTEILLIGTGDDHSGRRARGRPIPAAPYPGGRG